MLIVYVLLIGLLICFPFVKYGENQRYMSPTNTLTIKGFWVMVVFFCHYSGYVSLTRGADLPFVQLNSAIDQLCVVMFWFYSGYGIWCSYQNKEKYIKTFIKKRLTPVWLSFAICILLFSAENLLLGFTYSSAEVMLAFTGWTSVGNSNWYMFVTFVLYIIFYLVFRVFEKKETLLGLLVYTGTCIGLVVVLYINKEKEPWWYNTLLCFPAGMWFAVLKKHIDDFVFRNGKNYILVITVAIASFLITYLLKRWHGVFFILYAICFCVLIVIVTMKLTFYNKLLSFCGEHVFSIYMLQRLVFRFFQNVGLDKSPYCFFIISLTFTILLAVVYDNIFLKCKNMLSKSSVINV